jgi:hypothetical protein
VFVEEVDRSTQESKLIDFNDRVYEVYREVKHQQYLKDINVYWLFSRTNQVGGPYHIMMSR